jgi:hypothetical protein
MSSSNITGSSTTQDLLNLVQNLQNSVNSVSSAFATVQTNISNLNQVDTVHNTKIAQINTLDGTQGAEIAELIIENDSDANRLNLLELKFPITNTSILNETISKVKIEGLTSDLSTLTSGLNMANLRITDLTSLESSDVSTLTTNLNNQITKQSNDNTIITNNFNNLLASVPGSQNTFQTQIDTIKSNQLSDEGNITSLQSNVSSLNGDNSSNKSRLVVLETDNTLNKSNISTLQTGLSSANTNISNNTTSINNINTSLSSQIVKEAADYTNLSNRLDTLTSNSGSNTTSLQTQITNLSNDLNSDYTDLENQITTNKNAQVAGDAGLQSQLTDLKNTVENNNSSLSTALNSQVAKENSDVSNLQSQISSYTATNNARLTTDETDISNNKFNINLLINDSAITKSRVSVNENNIATNSSKVSVLESDNALNKSNITTLQNTDITHTNQLNVLEADNLTNKSDIHNLKLYDLSNNTNITNINTQLTNHNDDINTLKNTTIPSLDNKFVFKAGDTMTGLLNVSNIDNPNGVLNIGSNAETINIGSNSNNDNKTINIGGPNDVVNIMGSLNSVQTTNTEIKDKLITLNQGAVGSCQSGLSGFQIRDNDDNNAGYIVLDVSSNSYLIKAPQNENVYKVGAVDTFNSLTTKLYVDLQDSALQSSIAALQATTTELNNEITTINNNTINDVAFSRIVSYPSSANYLLNGVGQFVKVNNNVIDNNTINPLKLTGADGNANKFLNANGQFSSVQALDSSTVKIGDLINNNNNKKIVNVADGTDSNDVVNKSQLDNVNSNLTSYVDNKYLSQIDVSVIDNTLPGQLGHTLTKQFDVLCNVNVNNNNIKNVADAVDNSDAVNKLQLYNILSTQFQQINSNIYDNSISLNKLVGISPSFTDNYVVFNNGSTGKVNDNYISSISASKINNYPSDSSKVLKGDGSWGVVSSGSSLKSGVISSSSFVSTGIIVNDFVNIMVSLIENNITGAGCNQYCNFKLYSNNYPDNLLYNIEYLPDHIGRPFGYGRFIYPGVEFSNIGWGYNYNTATYIASPLSLYINIVGGVLYMRAPFANWYYKYVQVY